MDYVVVLLLWATQMRSLFYIQYGQTRTTAAAKATAEKKMLTPNKRQPNN